MTSALELRDLGKSFGNFWALRNVNIDFREGEVHALVGENGAGKSTLIKLIAGVYQSTEGALIGADGEALHITMPRDALKVGIGVVHQELDLFDNLTVAENIAIGIDDHGLVKPSAILMERRAKKALAELQEDKIHPGTQVGSLSTSDKQLVAIAKVLTWDARVIIFDEPTSALNAIEAARLLDRIKYLKSRGVTIIYVSHKLGEIFSIADRISVIRDGKLIATRPAVELDHEKIVETMLGRMPSDIYPHRRDSTLDSRPAIARISGLAGYQLTDASLDIRKGEILALAGLPDAGPSSVLQHIFGLRKMSAGTIEINGALYASPSPRKAIRAGFAYLPADRLLDGILPLMSVLKNAEATNEAMHATSKTERVSRALENIRRLSVRTASLFNRITSLSGGNQQKTLLARWLVMQPSILLLDDPTRGVDIGAKSEIYHILRSIADAGAAVVFTSSDSLELASLADRILLFKQGKVEQEINKVTHAELDHAIAAA